MLWGGGEGCSGVCCWEGERVVVEFAVEVEVRVVVEFAMGVGVRVVVEFAEVSNLHRMLINTNSRSS